MTTALNHTYTQTEASGEMLLQRREVASQSAHSQSLERHEAAVVISVIVSKTLDRRAWYHGRSCINLPYRLTPAASLAAKHQKRGP